LVVEVDELEIVEGSLFVAFLVSWSFTLVLNQWGEAMACHPNAGSQGEGVSSSVKSDRLAICY
jgi:hypothetical protein